MTPDTQNTSLIGISSSWGWPIGGALGGAIGAAAFGLLMWAFDPDALVAAIPAIYGLEPVGVVGWTIHVAHGVVLGIVFGFLITREQILGVIAAPTETDALSRTGVMIRVVAAGFVFGLAIWAILPLIVLPVWIEALGFEAAGGFPAVAVTSMLGHLLFGLVLGLVFAVTIDLGDRPATSPFEE